MSNWVCQRCTSDVSGERSTCRNCGWRKEWGTPRKTLDPPGEASRARATLTGPLPPAPEMREKALRVLLDVAEDMDALPTARVGAAKTLVELTGEPRKVLLELLNGDKTKLRAWLKAELVALDAEQSNGGEDHGHIEN